MNNVIMKAPSGLNASTTIILQDGTTTTIDAFGYITVDSKDRGRIIGREGQTIKALKGLLTALAPAGTQVVIDIAHPSS